MLHYYEVVMATRMIKLGKTESAHKQNFKVFDTKRHKTLPKSVVTTLPTATFTSNHSTVKLSLIQVWLVCMCGSATSVKAPRQMKTKVIFHPAQTYISSLRNARLNYKILGQPLLSTHTPVKLTKPQSCRNVHSDTVSGFVTKTVSCCNGTKSHKHVHKYYLFTKKVFVKQPLLILPNTVLDNSRNLKEISIFK